MNELTSWLLLNRLLVTGIVSAVLAVVVYFTNRDVINLHLKAYYYRFPLIGKNARLSKRFGMDDQNWFNSEREVCNSFLPYYDDCNADEYHYEQSARYLNKVGDTGIKPMSWYTWLGLSILVVIEAAGFAYILAGFTIQDGSEAIQVQGAIAIAIVLSMILVFLTHAMGGELYRNQQIGKVRLRWGHDETVKEAYVETDQLVGLTTKTNELDDNQPSWKQIANRLAKTNADFSKSWTMSILTVVVIAIVGIGATYVRGQVLEKLAIEEISGHQQDGMGSTFSIEDPFADAPPAELTSYNDEAEDAAFREAIQAHKRGGWMTFIILAVIFVAMQAISIFLGFKTTFSGKESAKAYKATHKFSNLNAYLDYHAAKRAGVERVAQSVLSHLQSKLAISARKLAGDKNILNAANKPSARTFINYYKLRELQNQQTPEVIQAQAPVAKTDAPVVESPAVQDAQAKVVSVDTGLTDADIIEKVKANELDGLTDEQIVAALKAINNEPKAETPQERLARLQQQAMS